MFRWFLITSAINVAYNDSNVEKRFIQTCETIASIKKYCPNSKIVLLEGSPKKLENELLNELLSKVSLYVPYYEDEMIGRIHNFANGNMQFVKSPSEIHLLLDFLRKQTFISPIDRVFKISGRHTLNENFNYNDHMEKNMIVIKNKESAVTYFDRETGKPLPNLSDYQYKTRLYSFCGSLIPYMIGRYEEMLFSLFRLYSNERFTDLEHIMYHVLGEKSVKQIPVLGLSGTSAENEQTVNE